jgi:hypothetical protein
MRRIRKLEATVENLQRNSSGIIEEETTVLSAAFDQINANQALLSQVRRDAKPWIVNSAVGSLTCPWRLSKLLQEAQVVDTEPLEVRQEREALQKKLDLMLPRSK